MRTVGLTFAETKAEKPSPAPTVEKEPTTVEKKPTKAKKTK